MQNKRLLILSASISLLVFIGCRKNHTDSPPPIETSTEIGELSAGDNSRILNHRPNKSATKATYEMNEPTPPTDAISMATYNPAEVVNGTSYILEIGQTKTSDINFADNINYYIKGNLTVSDISGTNGTPST